MKVKDKAMLVTLGAALLGVTATPVRTTGASPPEVTVRSLQQQGWTVIKTSSRNETVPGLPPYENLPRVVSITTYTLERDERIITCEIAYDSQRDTIEENCLDEGS